MLVIIITLIASVFLSFTGSGVLRHTDQSNENLMGLSQQVYIAMVDSVAF